MGEALPLKFRLVTAALGFWNAVEEIFPSTRHQ